MKLCKKCGQTKSLDDFGKDADARDGHNYLCRECARAYGRAAYQRNKAHLFDTGELTLECQHCGQEFSYKKTTGKRRMYCSERCKHEVSTLYRLQREANKIRQCECGSEEVSAVGKPVCRNCLKDKRQHKENKRRRLALHGLTEDRLNQILAQQRNRCAICETDTPGKRGWQVDHDHDCCPGVGSCGECIRGLLCHRCNLFLGLASDSIERLETAQRYLLKRANLLVVQGEAV